MTLENKTALVTGAASGIAVTVGPLFLDPSVRFWLDNHRL
jgi:hypothetical protein